MSIATLIQSETDAINDRIEVLEVEYDTAESDEQREAIEHEMIALSDSLLFLSENA